MASVWWEDREWPLVDNEDDFRAMCKTLSALTGVGMMAVGVMQCEAEDDPLHEVDLITFQVRRQVGDTDQLESVGFWVMDGRGAAALASAMIRRLLPMPSEAVLETIVNELNRLSRGLDKRPKGSTLH